MASCTEHVICLSNPSLYLYPENSFTRFTHRLPKPIDVLKGQRAYVALSTATVSTRLREDQDDVGFLKVHLSEIDPVVGPDSDERRVLARIPFRNGRLV